MSAADAAGRRERTLELGVGTAVLAGIALLLVLALQGRGSGNGDGYVLHAAFPQIDGLVVGSDVRLAGVTVGHVTQTRLDPKSFRAMIDFTVRPDIHLPRDSAAIVTSDSLLGGKYVALSPGGDERLLPPGGTVRETQGSISLEQLLSKFIFSVTDSLTKSKSGKTDGGP